MSSSPPPESEVFSDDSGVDVQSKRRNKRKSSEPKKRKDVLLMKRFRWDTDEEDVPGTEDVFERPSSGDSGCHLEDTVIRKSESHPQEDASSKEEAESRNRTRPRNYKSMSRQRRIEANARERTRVHTISAAFESLRRAVPAYAHNQKLSKLAILRIASAYIVALACLNEDPSSSSMAGCVEQCTRTIQAEGRSRRRTYKD